MPTATGSVQAGEPGQAADRDAGREEGERPARRSRRTAGAAGARSARPGRAGVGPAGGLAAERPARRSRAARLRRWRARPRRAPAPRRPGQRHSSHHDRTRRCTSTPNSGDRHQCQQQPAELERAGVEDRDDRDGEQVVDHGQGQQEGTQRRRQVGADHCQHAPPRRRCRSRSGSPTPAARRRRAQVDQDVEQGRHGHAADRGEHRDGSPPGSRRSPATNSRLTSSPATKKKIASSPSAAQVPAAGRGAAPRGRPQVLAQRCTPRTRASSPRRGRPRRRAAAGRRRPSPGAAAR